MKLFINKIYGYFVNLSKIFSRKNLNKFIYKELSSSNNLNRVLLIGAGGRIHDLLIKISQEQSFDLFTLDIDDKYTPDILSDVCEYNFTDDKYDVIVIPEVLQAIPTPEKAIANIHNGLNNNGSLILTVPFIFPIVDRPNDYFRFTKYGLKYLLKDFKHLNIFERNTWIESINVLYVRLIMNKDFISKFSGVIFILLAYITYPLIFILGKIIKSDFLTTGYNVIAKK
ncbi:MAG: class I SAM-dependent methyltransferase [Dehalococcoidia bacterium]